MKRKIIFVISLAVVFFLVAFIWWHSLQPGPASHAESRYVLSIVLSYANDTWLAPYLNDMHIRRLAHLTEYASLGLSMSFLSMIMSDRQHKIGTLIVGICIASIDEYIQQFSGGRTSTWHDVVFDTVGCGVGIMVVAVLSMLYRRYKY
jgi:VanZ family protein